MTLTFGLRTANAETIPTFYSSQNFDDGSVALENITTSGNAVVQDNALYLQNSYLSYAFDFYPISFDLEFDFKKIDMGSYSRLMYFKGINLEIEIKGSSNDLYIQGGYTGNWVMNEYSHFRFSYKNDILEIYLDNSLITSIPCSDVITGFQFGKGTSNSNYFNGYIDNLELQYNTYYFSDNFSLNEIPILPVPFDNEHLGDSSYFDELKIKNMNYCILYDSKDNALTNNKLQILCSDKILMLPDKNSLQRFKSVDLGEFSIVSFHMYDGKWYKGFDKTYTNGDVGDSGLELNGKIYATNYDFKRETEEVVYPYYSNRILFPHLSSIVSYDHQEIFSTEEVSSFYFNAVNPASSGLFQFKIEFESNNGIFPEYNFKYLTMALNDTTYNEEDDSISGFGFDYDDCVTSDNKMTCTGQIDLSLISSKRPNTTYYRWEQDIFNFDELDGTFTVYYTELANFGFATQESALKDLYKYMITSKDVLVSPNGEFDLYFNKDVRLWVYDTYNNAYKIILTTVLNENNYYYIHVATDEKNYLRIKTDDSSYVVYSNVSGLNFATVGENGDVSISIPGEENQNTNIGTGSEPSKEDIENGKWDSIESSTNKIGLIFQQNKGLIQSIFKIPKMLFGALPKDVQTVTAGLLFFFITAVLIKMMWR